MRKEGVIPFGLLYLMSGSNAGTDTLANDEGGAREDSHEIVLLTTSFVGVYITQRATLNVKHL